STRVPPSSTRWEVAKPRRQDPRLRWVMRKVVVQEFMSLDGVIQAPGARDEDPSNGFPYGGWTAPYTGGGEPRAREFMVTSMAPADLLLGRKTFEIFEAYWPDHAENWPGILDVTKYVVSTTLEGDRVAGSRWPNCKLLRSVHDAEAVARKRTRLNS